MDVSFPNPLTDAFAHHLAVVIELAGSVTCATFPLEQTLTFSSLCFLLTSWSTLTCVLLCRRLKPDGRDALLQTSPLLQAAPLPASQISKSAP